MLEKSEFFTSPDGTVYIKPFDKPMYVYDMSCREETEGLFILIRDLYPQAFMALSNLYSKNERNHDYFKYKIVHRFIRCNFGEYDALHFDISQIGTLNLEEVRCPLRGECINEGIICKPTLQSNLSPRETEVGLRLAAGLSNYEVAEDLGISICTVHRHICNIKARLHLRNTNQILSYFNGSKK